MKFLITFFILSIINVVFSTIRTIVTVKCGKLIASLVSGGYFTFYNIMLIWTVMDFPLWQKCIVTLVCNVIGVYIVKDIEEKLKKDKLWRITVTVPTEKENSVNDFLKYANLSFTIMKDVRQVYSIFYIYCNTQKESESVKNLINKYDVKYFVEESKVF